MRFFRIERNLEMLFLMCFFLRTDEKESYRYKEVMLPFLLCAE